MFYTFRLELRPDVEPRWMLSLPLSCCVISAEKSIFSSPSVITLLLSLLSICASSSRIEPLMCFGTISGPMVLYSTLHSSVQSIPSVGAERKNESGVGWDDLGVFGAAIGDLGAFAEALATGVPLVADVTGGLGGFLEAAEDNGEFTEEGSVGVLGEGSDLVSLVGVDVSCVCASISFGYTGVIASTPLSLPCSFEHRVSNNFFHASLSASLS